MQTTEHLRTPSDLALQELVNQPRLSLRSRNGHSRNQSGQSYVQGSERYEINIDSLRNSRFSDENGLGSSIATTNSKAFNSKRGKMGINLNSLV